MPGIAALTCLALMSGNTTPNPTVSRDAVRDAAKIVGFALYMPDETPKFYRLSSVEIQRVSGFASLGNRSVVRLTYTNERDLNSFDIFQTSSTSKVNPQDHMRWLMQQNVFEVSVHQHDTFVSVKKGTSDVGFLGGLVTPGSARRLLDRMVLVRP